MKSQPNRDRLSRLARKLREYPQHAQDIREAVAFIYEVELIMATEALVLTAYKNALAQANATVATVTAGDVAKDATIADLTGKLAAAQANTKDAADVAAEQQAIADLGLNADGTHPAAAPPTPPTDVPPATPAA